MALFVGELVWDDGLWLAKVSSKLIARDADVRFPQGAAGTGPGCRAFLQLFGSHLLPEFVQ
jgi:hypothetical protein